jgi:hypothetical protein
MKNLFNSIAVSLLAVGLMLCASAFGQTIVPSTTLAAAVTSTNSQLNTFKLASTSGITAGNTMLYIDGEADFVNAVTTTPATVTVTRGQPTSRVSTHVNGAIVWYGPPSYFYFQNPIGYPSGSCTRSQSSVLPYIDIGNSVISDCLGGVWVNGINSPLSPKVVFAPASGGSVLTGVGTSTATTNTSMYCVEADLPTNKLLTGLELLQGTVAGNGNRNAILYDWAGNLLAHSASIATASGNESLYAAYPFTAKYFAVGPASYWACSQASNSSDTLNLIVTADGNAGLYTQIYTGQTFGTIPATITPSAAYTTGQGPYAAFY